MVSVVVSTLEHDPRGPRFKPVLLIFCIFYNQSAERNHVVSSDDQWKSKRSRNHSISPSFWMGHQMLKIDHRRSSAAVWRERSTCK